MTRYITPELHAYRQARTSIKEYVTKNFTIFDIERFLSKIYQLDDCWLLKSKSTQRYSTYKGHRAHRVSWELFRGRIPSNLTLDHLCLNKRCVNPGHLEPVSSSENSKRWNAK